MRIDSVVAWLMGRPKRWVHLQRVPMRHLKFMMMAAFLLFSVIGFYMDIMSGGTMPYANVLLYAILAGSNAILWIWVLARMPMSCMVLLIAFQFFFGAFNQWAGGWLTELFHPSEVPPLADYIFLRLPF